MKIKAPAKLNLTLEIINKRSDGFHNIKSVMQTINLYDYLTINIKKSDGTIINLSGTSNEIPYDETNLVYRAAKLFLNKTGIKNYQTDIYIEKNIPISAGLAGGSADAAGTIYGLNKIFDNLLSKSELHELCAILGSDLNVCMAGGCLLATSRGEVINELPFIKTDVSLIKPLRLGISAKEAYTKYSALKDKPNYDMTSKIIKALKNDEKLDPFLYNDLETAVFNDYNELKIIKKNCPNSIMSGSGPTYFALNTIIKNIDGYWIKNGLCFIPNGVSEV